MSTDTLAPSPSAKRNASTGETVVAEDQQAKRSVATGLRRVVYLAAAGGFFLLGVAGAVLPGLPATPFLLLTSYFLIRSSPRLNQRLLNSRVFGPILVDWQVHGGVRPHVKVKAIAVVIITVAVSVCVSGYSVIFASVVCGLAMVGVAVILWLPVACTNQSAQSRTEDS